MRPDMAKVIVERPRYGSKLHGVGKGYWRKLQRMHPEELPTREPMKQARSKQFNEHLGPLRRYLRKQVGRSWNQIHSELRRQIGRDTVVNNHVFTHVFQYVATDVVEFAGELHVNDGLGSRFPLGYGRFPLFYVCPRSGTLKIAPRDRWRRQQRQKALPELHLAVEYDLSFVRLQGVWMRVRLEPYPKMIKRDEFGFPLPVFDALRKEAIGRAAAVQFYGRAVTAIEARPASRAEIRKYCEPLKAPNLV